MNKAITYWTNGEGKAAMLAFFTAKPPRAHAAEGGRERLEEGQAADHEQDGLHGREDEVDEPEELRGFGDTR
jgi:hypothetical protein